MNMPTDPKERMKLFAVIGIFGVGIIVAGVMFGVRPLLDKNKQKVAKIQDLKNKLRKANKIINRIPRLQQDNTKVIAQIKTKTDRYLLPPTFGDYLLGAKAIVEKAAHASGVPKPPVLQVGHTTIMQPPRQKEPNAFRMYTVRVRCKTGLHQLLPFFFHLETRNPYLSVAKVSIAASATSPADHNVTFDVQWPVWADAKLQESLAKQLKEAEAGAARIRQTTDSANKG